MAQSGVANRLPKKEAELFRSLVSCYETKQYKKGMKIADSILKKYPNNGETQAMKGIIFNCLGKKTEAYDMVKLGVRNDMRSHVCWHVYGLLYRSDNNYKEASKCYLNALRIDPSNQNILRDLSFLQAQMRDKAGFANTRRRILESKPGLRASWVTFAVAQFLMEDYSSAFDIISKFYESVSDRAEAYEESELMLFQNLCLERRGLYDEALKHLDTNKDNIVDKLSWEIKQAQLLTLAGKFEDAEVAWQRLLASQPEHYRLHCGMQITLLRMPEARAKEFFALKHLELPCTVIQLSADEKALLRKWYEAEAFFAKSRTCQKILQYLLLGCDLFEESFQKFVSRGLEDGLPSLYHDVCAMVTEMRGERMMLISEPAEFAQHAVTRICRKVLEPLLQTCASNPQAVLWALYLEAHLLERSGDLLGALHAIDRAIEHTPTAIDVLVRKAHLLKKSGKFLEAAIFMDECRALDLQDRYLNNKATKYFLRADEPMQALNTISMFVKHDATSGDVQKTLFDLQCSWYEMECAESYSRLKKWGPALKKFYSIRKHFADQYDDLFDFHGYCVRKTTLRAYLDTMTTQDTFFGHATFQRAFRGAVGVLVYLLDCPEDADGLGHLPPNERKKERAKVKKLKEKKAKEAADKAAEQAGDDTTEVKEKVEDEDPEGELLLAKDFSTEIAGWCALLAPHLHLCSAETQAAYVEACVRRGKFLTAARALTVGHSQHRGDPALHLATVRLLHKAKGNKKVSAQVLHVVREVLHPLVGERVQDFAQQFLDRACLAGDLPRVIAGVKAMCLLDKVHGAKLAEEVLGDETRWGRRGVTVQAVMDAVKFLRANFDGAPVTTFFTEKARELFGGCPLFASPQAEARSSKPTACEEA